MQCLIVWDLCLRASCDWLSPETKDKGRKENKKQTKNLQSVHSQFAKVDIFVYMSFKIGRQ